MECARELGCCGCRGLASEVMIYCFASFDNWQMETTRCRAREGGKLLSIRTPLTFTVEQRNPILCCLLQRSCAGFEQLQRLCRHMERQPALLGVPVPSSCVLCPVSCMERLPWSLGPLLCLHGNKMLETAPLLLKNYTGLSTAGEVPPIFGIKG